MASQHTEQNAQLLAEKGLLLPLDKFWTNKKEKAFYDQTGGPLASKLLIKQLRCENAPIFTLPPMYILHHPLQAAAPPGPSISKQLHNDVATLAMQCYSYSYGCLCWEEAILMPIRARWATIERPMS